MKSEMFSILNITGEKTLYKTKAKSLTHAVEIAVEKGVDLGAANLEGADLSKTNLSGAKLESANMNNSNLRRCSFG
jgi:uncharacterized protein YjbI with pentapeptide repeats